MGQVILKIENNYVYYEVVIIHENMIPNVFEFQILLNKCL